MAAPPNLQRHINEMRAAVRQLPGVAAGTMEDLAARGNQEQRAPDGSAWRPVLTQREDKGAKYDEKVGRFRVGGRFARGRGAGRGFDPHHHIRYYGVVEGERALLRSYHPAAAFSRWGTKHMPARPQVPGRDDSLAFWLPILLAALRAPIQGVARGQ